MSDKAATALVPYREAYERAWREIPLGSEDERLAQRRLDELLARGDLEKQVFHLPENFAPYQLENKAAVVQHNLCVLRAFREALGDAPRLLVVDPHHPCHHLDVSVPLEAVASEDEIWGMKKWVRRSEYFPLWKVEVLPTGDIASFVSPVLPILYQYDYQMDLITKTEPPQKVEVWGAALIAALRKNRSPLLLG